MCYQRVEENLPYRNIMETMNPDYKLNAHFVVKKLAYVAFQEKCKRLGLSENDVIVELMKKYVEE